MNSGDEIVNPIDSLSLDISEQKLWNFVFSNIFMWLCCYSVNSSQRDTCISIWDIWVNHWKLDEDNSDL